MSSSFHAPVLLAETGHYLAGAREVLDCTLGDGGHTEALLRSGARVTALDQDPEAIERAMARLPEFIAAGKLRVVHSNFAAISAEPLLAEAQFDGILLDLGVSSRQLDSETRGFTFRPGAKLDMRMDPGAPVDAAELLNSGSQAQLQEIIQSYSDEPPPRARRLAAEIVRRRQRAPFLISDDLVGAIRAVFGPRSGPSEFARIFQGIRIAVNDEIAALTLALPHLRDHLKPSGVMVVISYHSGEDRLVKHAFRDWARGCICPPRQPICTCGQQPLGETLTRRAVKAGDEEIKLNPRARSARLRAWRRNG